MHDRRRPPEIVYLATGLRLLGAIVCSGLAALLALCVPFDWLPRIVSVWSGGTISTGREWILVAILVLSVLAGLLVTLEIINKPREYYP